MLNSFFSQLGRLSPWAWLFGVGKVFSGLRIVEATLGLFSFLNLFKVIVLVMVVVLGPLSLRIVPLS